MGHRRHPAGPRVIFLRAAATLLLLLAGGGRAADRNWIGAGTGSNTAIDPNDPNTRWDIAANWQEGVVPTYADIACLTFTGPGQVNATGIQADSVYVDGAVTDAALAIHANVAFYLIVESDMRVGVDGYGKVILDGGYHRSGSLCLGYNIGSTGVYELRSGRRFSNSSDYVGYRGSGRFIQTGGVCYLNSGSLSVGFYTGSSGIYELHDGVLDTPSEQTKAGSRFDQQGGTHIIHGSMNLDGAYDLAGGTLSAAQVSVQAGAVFSQTGGEHSVGTLTFAVGGEYSLYDGTLTATTVSLPSGALLRAEGDLVALVAFNQTGGRIEGALENRGTFTYENGDFDARLVNLGQVDLRANFLATQGCENYGTFTIPPGCTVTANGPGLTNRATMTLNGGKIAGTSLLNDFSGKLLGKGTVDVPLTNNGTLELTGLLAVAGPVANAGTIGLSALETLSIAEALENTGKVTLTSASIIGAGSIRNDPGGVINGSGGIAVPLANNGGSIRALSGSLTITDMSAGSLNGGEVSIATNSTLAVPSGFPNGGVLVLEGTGALLTGGQVWNTGTVEGSGRIANSLTNEGLVRAYGGKLTLSGAGTVNAATGDIEIESGATVSLPQGLPENAGGIVLRNGTLDAGANVIGNTGTIRGYGLLRCRELANTGDVTVGEGNLSVLGDVVNDGTFGVQAARVVTFYGDVSGAGSFPGPGTYNFLGSLSPGNSAGTLCFGGDVSFASSARLHIELAEADNADPIAPRYDALHVAGDVVLGGTLVLDWLPTAGEPNSRFGGAYDLITYAGDLDSGFAGIAGTIGEAYVQSVLLDADLGGGLKAVRITLHPQLDGDCDLDGDVDGDDLTVLEAGQLLPDPSWFDGDLNFDDAVDHLDYLVWKAHSGDAVPSGGIPEPATLGLLALGGLAAVQRRRR